MQTIKIFIPGIPKPKQSVRSRIVAPKNGKPFVTHYQSQEVKKQERAIAAIVSEQLPENFICHDGPIEVVSLKFAFPITSSLRAAEKKMIAAGIDLPKITKPDLTDNLSKGLFDAMEGIVYTNDSKVFKVTNSTKVLSSRPGIYLRMHLYDSLKEVTESELAKRNLGVVVI